MNQVQQLLPGVSLRCFRDSRFKQGILTVQFVRPMDRAESSLNALIPEVLLRGCRSAPDLRAIIRRLDDLYGASVGPLARRVGDYQAIGLGCRFISDRYTMEGDRILAPMIDFLQQLLYEPVTEKGVFSADFIEGEKTNLISEIEAQRNDKRSYAAYQLLKNMCKNDSYGLPRLGEPEDVRCITPETAWQHWQKVLKESTVQFFYVGEAEPEAVAALLRPVLAALPRDHKPLPPQTPFHPAGGGRYEETMDVAQARLGMGFFTPITTLDPRMPAMQMCNRIFGGGMTGKLFMNVREKMSLCYDISSGYHVSKGILTVAAGIDFSKETVVREEVLRQLDAIRRGDISQEELTAAKAGLCNTLRGTYDSPGSIESHLSTIALSGLPLTTEEYIHRVEAVTAAEVAEAAATLTEDTVYFLKGVQ